MTKYEERIASIEKAVSEQGERLRWLCEAMPVKTVFTVRDIAKMRGTTPQSLRVKPWLMPNLGKPDYEDKPMRWNLSSILKWQEKYGEHPEDARRDWIAEQKSRIGGEDD